MAGGHFQIVNAFLISIAFLAELPILSHIPDTFATDLLVFILKLSQCLMIFICFKKCFIQFEKKYENYSNAKFAQNIS